MTARSPSLRPQSVAMAHYAEGRMRPMHQRTTEVVTVNVCLLSAFTLTARFKRIYRSSRACSGCPAHGSRWMRLGSCPRHQMPPSVIFRAASDLRVRPYPCGARPGGDRYSSSELAPYLGGRLGCSPQAYAFPQVRPESASRACQVRPCDYRGPGSEYGNWSMVGLAIPPAR